MALYIGNKRMVKTYIGESGGGPSETIYSPIVEFFQSKDMYDGQSDSKYLRPELNEFNSELFDYSEGVFTAKETTNATFVLNVWQYKSSSNSAECSLYVNGTNRLTTYTSSGIDKYGKESITIQLNTGDSFYLKKANDKGWASPYLLIFDDSTKCGIRISENTEVSGFKGFQHVANKLIDLPYTRIGGNT